MSFTRLSPSLWHRRLRLTLYNLNHTAMTESVHSFFGRDKVQSSGRHLRSSRPVFLAFQDLQSAYQPFASNTTSAVRRKEALAKATEIQRFGP